MSDRQRGEARFEGDLAVSSAARQLSSGPGFVSVTNSISDNPEHTHFHWRHRAGLFGGREESDVFGSARLTGYRLAERNVIVIQYLHYEPGTMADEPRQVALRSAQAPQLADLCRQVAEFCAAHEAKYRPRPMTSADVAPLTSGELRRATELIGEIEALDEDAIEECEFGSYLASFDVLCADDWPTYAVADLNVVLPFDGEVICARCLRFVLRQEEAE